MAQIAVGKCCFCKEEFTENLLTKHLQKHLKDKSKTNKLGLSYLVRVIVHPKWGNEGYFLLLWINENCTMEKVDDLLRNIWLECCGHLSDFTYETAKQKNNRWDIFKMPKALIDDKLNFNSSAFENEIALETKAKAILHKGLKLNYDYDYGSTTKLQLKVVEEYPIKADRNLTLLSRNEPLSILCEDCGKKQAVLICTTCIHKDKSAFCKKCSLVHNKECDEFEDYAGLPVVNSPRMGVCGYEGGTVDMERDGIFFEKVKTSN